MCTLLCTKYSRQHGTPPLLPALPHALTPVPSQSDKHSWRKGDSEKSGKPPDLLRIKRPSIQQQRTLNNSSMKKNKKVYKHTSLT
jgi:hypothetical protein